MDQALLDRIDRIEAHQAIQQLAVKYAMAVDARDVDAWLGMFVDDIDCGRRGKGREALRSFIEPAVRDFYRTVHSITGHAIDVRVLKSLRLGLQQLVAVIGLRALIQGGAAECAAAGPIRIDQHALTHTGRARHDSHDDRRLLALDPLADFTQELLAHRNDSIGSM